MNINVKSDVQGLLRAYRAIWLQEYKEITLLHSSEVMLRLNLEVNLRSAGQIKSMLD